MEERVELEVERRESWTDRSEYNESGEPNE